MQLDEALTTDSCAVFTSGSFDELRKVIDAEFPLRHDALRSPLTYGTAGFRTNGALLPPVAARVSMIAALRSVYCQAKRAAEGQTAPCMIGIMVTASHNPYVDNGFKIIDVDGGMLAPSWEEWCTRAANATSGSDLQAVMMDCVAHDPTAFRAEVFTRCVVHFSRDTRPSGEGIVNAGLTTLRVLQNTTADSRLPISTPYMHYIVARANEVPAPLDAQASSYYDSLLAGFEEMLSFARGGEHAASREGATPQKLVVDCANGIGALAMAELAAAAKLRRDSDVFSTSFETALVDCNTRDETFLNSQCGADFAKLHATPSAAMCAWPGTCASSADAAGTHFYSLDGDADRLVAFVYDAARSPSWVLLDGDRIAILYAMLLHKWLGEEQMRSLDVAVVQTAYANGASTQFLEEQLHMKVYTAATGVKNLHPVAHARDVGVYFEANGHGTVLISEKVAARTAGTEPEKNAPLAAMRRVLSQCCGDAVADLLMCEVALAALGMSFQEWAALYVDRPCKQTKVTVAHPRRITNTPDERRALSPAGMQEQIDAAVTSALSQCEAARAFVRPSGTEPVVRVYAEASDPHVCESLSAEVMAIVKNHCS
ncbi:N-acetylglucosamine-phosphate mutase [Novymonas esmeraldas]|uniref:Phosphoacetylglucosamine mutase n=1 Tax=Novymonas esmeraldas TaxID=1808958 RepID=A0AAW0F7U3_9TRYP